MTRPIYIETLRRLVTAPQYALLERLRGLYGSGKLDVDDAGLLRSPNLSSASDLVDLHQFLQSNRSSKFRQGRVNWLDEYESSVSPPVDGNVEEAQIWIDHAVKAINEKLQLIEMFDD